MNLADLLKRIPRLKAIGNPPPGTPTEQIDTLQRAERAIRLLDQQGFQELMEDLCSLRDRYQHRLREDDQWLHAWRWTDALINHITSYLAGNVDHANEVIDQIEDYYAGRTHHRTSTQDRRGA